MYRRLAGVIQLILVFALLSGCSAGGSLEKARQAEGTAIPLSSVMRTVDWSAVEDLEATTLWSASRLGRGPVSIAPDGGLVAADLVEVDPADGTVRRTGFATFDQGGRRLGSVTFPEPTEFGRTTVLGGGLIAASYMRADQALLGFFAPAGDRLWHLELEGPASVAASAVSQDGTNGRRIAVLDRKAGTVRLLDDKGALLKTIDVSGTSGSLRFAGRYLIVEDAERILVLDAEGAIKGRFDDSGQIRRHVAVSSGLRHIAVTTGASDNLLYLFEIDLMSALTGTPPAPYAKAYLSPGGAKDVVFNPEATRVYVYNVGPEAEILAYAVEDGQVAWRTVFARPEGWSLTVERLAFDAAGDTIALLQFRPLDPPAENGQPYYVVAGLDDQGAPLWHEEFAPGSRVDLSERGDAMVVRSDAGLAYLRIPEETRDR